MADYVRAWQCIGCGSIEAPQTCIGVCEHRKVQFVYAFEHEAALARERQRADALESVVRQLARTSPRQGEFERSYRALQELARRALSSLAQRADERSGEADTQAPG